MGGRAWALVPASGQPWAALWTMVPVVSRGRPCAPWCASGQLWAALRAMVPGASPEVVEGCCQQVAVQGGQHRQLIVGVAACGGKEHQQRQRGSQHAAWGYTGRTGRTPPALCVNPCGICAYPYPYTCGYPYPCACAYPYTCAYTCACASARPCAGAGGRGRLGSEAHLAPPLWPPSPLARQPVMLGPPDMDQQTKPGHSHNQGQTQNQWSLGCWLQCSQGFPGPTPSPRLPPFQAHLTTHHPLHDQAGHHYPPCGMTRLARL